MNYKILKKTTVSLLSELDELDSFHENIVIEKSNIWKINEMQYNGPFFYQNNNKSKFSIGINCAASKNCSVIVPIEELH